MEATEELRDVLLAAFRDAEQRRHEYVTLEHVLFAISTDAARLEDAEGAGGRHPDPAAGPRGLLRRKHRPACREQAREVKQTPTFQRVLQRAASTCRPPAATQIDTGNLLVVVLPRARLPRRLPAREAGRHAPRRAQVHLARHRQGSAAEPAEAVGAGGVDGRRRGRRAGARTRSRRLRVDLTQRARDGQHRSADRPRRRARAHDPGALPPPQEQPALRRRAGRRQDRHRRGPRAAHRRGQGAGGCSRTRRSTRSTWARCSPAPSSAASSRQRLKGVIELRDQKTRRHPVHRRDPHHRRRRRDERRLDGRLEHAQAGAGRRRAALHRLDDVQRLQAARSSATARWRAASRTSTSASRRSPRRSRSCKGLKKHYEEHHGVIYTDAALEAAAELSATHINERHLPDKAHRRDRRGRRDGAPARRRRRRQGHERRTIEEVVAQMARIPTQPSRPTTATRWRTSKPSSRRSSSARTTAIDAARRRHQALALRPRRAGQARSASFLFAGPTGVGKTELAKQLARVLGVEFIRFDMTRVHGEAHRVAAHRRAARLRRLRPGRPAHRRHPQDAVRGAAARRDREGAPGHLQHPAAGDGPRDADRQQRPQGRLPQRHPDHDDQRRRRASSRASRWASASATRAAQSKDAGRRSSARSARVPQPPRRLDHVLVACAPDVIGKVVGKFIERADRQLGGRR